jgi:hypothetical protein
VNKPVATFGKTTAAAVWPANEASDRTWSRRAGNTGETQLAYASDNGFLCMLGAAVGDTVDKVEAARISLDL